LSFGSSKSGFDFKTNRSKILQTVKKPKKKIKSTNKVVIPQSLKKKDKINSEEESKSVLRKGICNLNK
jgi:hypothetical protein